MPARRLRGRRSTTGAERTVPGRVVRPAARRRSRRGRADLAARGASSLEFAMVLPLLAAVTIALCGVVVLARDAVLAQGAAREGARAVAVGGDRSLAATAARRALPAGRKATVVVSYPAVDRVRVRVRVWIPLPYGAAVPVAADAVTAVEPGTERRSGGGTSGGPTTAPRPS